MSYSKQEFADLKPFAPEDVIEMKVGETKRARVTTCTLLGIEAIPVHVEIEVSPGEIPNWTIVGMGDTAVREAKQRVRAALKCSRYTARSDRKVLVNLAPASMRKSGSGFDLPMAIAYLIATEQIDARLFQDTMIVGELSLDGSVRSVDGLFAHALCAKKLGYKLVSGPANMKLPQIDGLEHLCLAHLGQINQGGLQPVEMMEDLKPDNQLDYSQVVGQELALRALTIAAAGGHGVLMIGPPGAGKSMLAQRFPTILPPLSQDERIESAVIHSVAGLDVSSIASGIRPFRAPHHSATSAALIGGGQPIMPGEVSLAHRGVLFLDELGEFSTRVLQVMRQPLEDGQVSICRAQDRLIFPARFQLLAASNPCPCGYLGDKERACTCRESDVSNYKSKLGGPLKDRIDLTCNVTRVDPSRVLDSGKGRSSAEIAEQVAVAREYAAWRARDNPARRVSTPQEAIAACALGQTERDLIEKSARLYHLSGRGIIRVLKVARTIADFEESAAVSSKHLSEALLFRVEELGGN